MVCTITSGGVDASGLTVNVSHDDGSPDTKHKIDKSATVTLNGKPAKLGDLQAGDTVVVSGSPATSVAAKR